MDNPNNITTPSSAEQDDFFSHLKLGDVPGALECFENRLSREERVWKWRNNDLIKSSLKRNCSDHLITEFTWYNFISDICQQWKKKWEKHLNKKELCGMPLHMITLG